MVQWEIFKENLNNDWCVEGQFNGFWTFVSSRSREKAFVKAPSNGFDNLTAENAGNSCSQMPRTNPVTVRVV